jgi:hypothetical protein
MTTCRGGFGPGGIILSITVVPITHKKKNRKL